MFHETPCRIDSGPATPEDQIEMEESFGSEDEDEAYGRWKQEQVDDAAARERARKRREDKLNG